MTKTFSKILLSIITCIPAAHAFQMPSWSACKNFYWNYNFKYGQVTAPSVELIAKHAQSKVHENKNTFGSEPLVTDSLKQLFAQNFAQLNLDPAKIKILGIQKDLTDLYLASGSFMIQTDRCIWINEDFFTTQLTQEQREAAVAYLCCGIESNFARKDSLVAVATGAMAVGMVYSLDKLLNQNIPYISGKQAEWGPYLANWVAFLTAIYAAQYANKKSLNVYSIYRVEKLLSRYAELGHNTQALKEVFEKSDELSGATRYAPAITMLDNLAQKKSMIAA